jgi:prepilin signal peptidase PulO-like enzyme (type II secretory pathway)
MRTAPGGTSSAAWRCTSGRGTWPRIQLSGRITCGAGSDVKLSGVLALYLGWNSPRASLFGVVGAFLLAALAALAAIVMLIGRRADRKTDLPFGPFMLAAALLAIM